MGVPSILNSITDVTTVKQKHKEKVTVSFNVAFTFDKDEIDFSDKLETVRARAESLLSRMSATEIKKKILFETAADFYYTDNNGVETKI